MNRGCAVLVEGPDEDGGRIVDEPFYSHEQGVSQLSCSGLVITPSLVLCSALPFAPFVGHGEALQPGCRIRIVHGKNTVRSASILRFVFLPDVQDLVRQIVGLHPQLSVGWPVHRTQRQLDIRKALNMPADSHHERARVQAERLRHMCGFVLLALASSLESILQPLRILPPAAVPAAAGTDILCISSPFGSICSTILADSVSKGSICNHFQLEPASVQHPPAVLYLLDCRCLPGSEGSPVLRAVPSEAPVLESLVLAPIHHELSGVEFHLGVPASIVFGDAMLSGVLAQSRIRLEGDRSLGACPCATDLLVAPMPAAPDIAACASAFSCLISCGTKWGTGILVSRSGYVITCAHVVSEAVASFSSASSTAHAAAASSSSFHPQQCCMISARFDRQGMPSLVFPCRLVFMSIGSLDLALLHLSAFPSASVGEPAERCSLAPVTAFCRDCRDCTEQQIFAPGSGAAPVFVYGFAVFGSSCGASASLTGGSLCNVARRPRVQQLSATMPGSQGKGRATDECINGRTGIVCLQADAAVHLGNSGGPLLSVFDCPHSGRREVAWIGIVMQHGARPSGSTLPRLNFSIAVDEAAPLLLFVSDVDRAMHREPGGAAAAGSSSVARNVALQRRLDMEKECLVHRNLDAIFNSRDEFVDHVFKFTVAPTTRVVVADVHPRARL